MPVERNQDGSVTIKSEKSTTTIGRVVTYKKYEEKFYKQWIDDCAMRVTACAHTFTEVEQYFLEQCDALPLKSDDRRMKIFQKNVILNYCKDKLEHPSSDFSFEMTDEEMEKWHEEQKAMHEEVMNARPEHFGLTMRGYYLPHTQKNAIFYGRTEVERNLKQTAQIIPQDIYFFFEEATENYQATGGGENLLQQMIVFRGITENDIKERNPRFMGYISTLRDMGQLPDIPKE